MKPFMEAAIEVRGRTKRFDPKVAAAAAGFNMPAGD
jgi:hypothetical protein